MNKIKVSIIMPVYNQGTFLYQSLESVLAQTLKEIEVICVDDGSNDESSSIIQNFEKLDSRVKYLCQINSGSGIARNKGLEVARGEYVAFLDADDYYLDINALESMYSACERYKVNVCGSFRKILEDGVISDYVMYREELKGFPEGKLMHYREYQYDFHYHNYLFKLDMIKENHIEFPDYIRFQDPPFFVRAMIQADKFYVIPVELYCYRVGHQNLNYDTRRMVSILKGIRDIVCMAKTYQLDILLHRELERINEEYYWNIIENISTENIGKLEIIQILIEINQIIDLEGISLRPLDYIMRLSVECYSLAHRKYWRLQEKILEPGSDIVIYGAGDIGQDYYEQLNQNKDYTVVLWVDKQYEKYQKKGLNVKSPESIINHSFDYIIISLLNKTIADNVKEYLKNLGVTENKIIWQENAEKERVNV